MSMISSTTEYKYVSIFILCYDRDDIYYKLATLKLWIPVFNQEHWKKFYVLRGLSIIILKVILVCINN